MSVSNVNTHATYVPPASPPPGPTPPGPLPSGPPPSTKSVSVGNRGDDQGSKSNSLLDVKV